MKQSRDGVAVGNYLGHAMALLAILLAAFFAGSSSAEASHYRYGSMSWTPGTGNTINFTHQEAWARDSFGNCWDIVANVSKPCSATYDTYAIVGDIVAQSDSGTDYGDGSGSFRYGGYVNGFDNDPDFGWVYWTLLDPNSYPAVDTSISHTYPATGDYTWVNDGCCRVDDMNNGGDWRLESIVNVGSGNRSPVSLLPPFVLCQENAVCQFNIPAIDPDGDDLSFRFSTSVEDDGMNQPGAPEAPNEATIDASTGVYTWNTTGATVEQDPEDPTYYSTQVVVEDLDGSGIVKSKTPITFLIQIVPFVPGVAPVFDENVGPTCGSTINGSAGSTISFDVIATDADLASGDTVTLNAVGLPSGASMTPLLPLIANPVTSSFSWTPTTSDIGGNVAFFTATDTTLRQTQCAITINVAVEGPRYENTSDRVEYDSDCWTTVDNPSASGGSAAASKKKRCKAQFEFTGDRVDFISAKGPMMGRAYILIDNVYHMPVDLYANTLQGNKRVFSRTFSKVGDHEITVRVAGNRNSRSSANYVAIDAFEVYNEEFNN